MSADRSFIRQRAGGEEGDPERENRPSRQLSGIRLRQNAPAGQLIVQISGSFARAAAKGDATRPRRVCEKARSVPARTVPVAGQGHPGRYFAISGNCAQLSAVNASCTCELRGVNTWSNCPRAVAAAGNSRSVAHYPRRLNHHPSFKTYQSTWRIPDGPVRKFAVARSESQLAKRTSERTNERTSELLSRLSSRLFALSFPTKGGEQL